jgi:acyl-coenzyme A synthetase/AMP-(fatty) acid ligase
MTEASSQVATSLTGDTNWLPILPHWETRISREGILMIRGAALMRGSFSRTTNGKWKWNEATDEKGFYTTGDRVEIHDGKLRPLGRADDHVKILGELVSLAKVEASLSQNLGVPAVVLEAPDERRGAKLIAFLETEADPSDPFAEWNESMPPYEQISEVGFVKEFPRTEAGKIDRAKLRHHREDFRTEPANEKAGDSHDCEHHGKGL